MVECHALLPNSMKTIHTLAFFANVAYTDASPAEEVTDQIYNEIDENCSYNERVSQENGC